MNSQPPHPTSSNQHDDNEYIIPLAVPVVSSIIESDLELARRLQAEEDAYASSYSTSSPPPPPRPPQTTQPQHHTIATLQDEAYARMLDQELRDQQYARSLQEQEERNIAAAASGTPPATPSPVVVVAGIPSSSSPSSYPQNSIISDIEVQRAQALALEQFQIQQQEQTRRRQRNRRRHCIMTILLFLLIGAFIAGILYFSNIFGTSAWIGGRPPPYITDPWNNKPSNGSAIGEYIQWPTNGNGLKLTIQDALTDDWYPYFKQAFLDWDASPALTLTLVNATRADPSCTAIRGILKVCNKNYGDTGWLGINDCILQNNVIYSSVAKMNEYYLNKSSNALRQYVMCHEIGHGFGLPHRDENFNNAELGTCLDYTSKPQDNMHPNSVDFDHLAQLYLYKQSHNSTRLGSSSSSSSLPDSILRTSSSLSSLLDLDIQNRPWWSYRDGQLIHKSKHSEIWETKLTDNIRVRTRVLLLILSS